MCPRCVSGNPGRFVPGPVFLLDKRELWHTFWTAGVAAVAPPTRLRFAQPASLARGEANCLIRLKWYHFPNNLVIYIYRDLYFNIC
jgi:hypothetical protein